MSLASFSLENKVTTYVLTFLAAAWETARALYEEQAAADAGYRKVYEHWKAFRENSFRWWSTAEPCCKSRPCHRGFRRWR